MSTYDNDIARQSWGGNRWTPCSYITLRGSLSPLSFYHFRQFASVERRRIAKQKMLYWKCVLETVQGDRGGCAHGLAWLYFLSI